MGKIRGRQRHTKFNIRFIDGHTQFVQDRGRGHGLSRQERWSLRKLFGRRHIVRGTEDRSSEENQQGFLQWLARSGRIK